MGAALIGSIVEWYDLFAYGSLVVTLSAVFFPATGTVPPILPALGAFVAGAAVRPLGGALFGRYGDLVGRKFAFMLTTVIMGLGSVAVGLLPTYRQVGILAPVALVVLRVMQGLALGGEYRRRCNIHRREHFRHQQRPMDKPHPVGVDPGPPACHRRGTGDAPLRRGCGVPKLGVARSVSRCLSPVGDCHSIRLKVAETPLFTTLKKIKKTSSSPLSDSLTERANLRMILLATVVVSGASVVWHTAEFYTSIFMQNTLKIDFLTAGTITAGPWRWALPSSSSSAGCLTRLGG